MKKLIILSALLMQYGLLQVDAATLTSGHTWTNSELVTAAKLNDQFNSGSISAIQGSDISAGAIGNSQMAANSISGNNIQSLTIPGGDLINYTLTSTQVATNGLMGWNLNPTFTLLPSFTFTFTNGTFNMGNSAMTINLSNSVIQVSSNQIPLYGVNGAVSGSLALSSNINGYSYTSGAGYTYSTILQMNTTFTTGSVHVIGKALIAPSQAHTVFLRVRDSGNTVWGNAAAAAIGGGSATPYVAELHDTLTGTAKTYLLEVATSATATSFTNVHSTGVGGVGGATNGLGMTIFQVK